MKYFYILFIPIIIIANDLIVDQDANEIYNKDNYLLFDPYGGDTLTFCGNKRPPNGSPENCDRVEIIHSEQISSGPILGNTFTIEVWVYSDSTTVNHREIIGVGLDPSGNSINRPPTITYNLNHQIRYGFGDGSIAARFIVNNVRTERAWDHIAFTFDGNSCKLYVNGELEHNSDYLSGKMPIQIPIKYIGEEFQGKIDEVRIWNITRTQEEIQTYMNDILTGNEVGLVAYYPMEINENFQIIDMSPNQYHATLTDVEILSRYYSAECPNPDGSYECPYPTIRSALDDAKPGDRIYIRHGRYTELLNKWQLNHTHETQGEKITIEGYPNEEIILDGTISINSNWEPYTFNNLQIYKTVLDMDSISAVLRTPIDSIYGVFVDGRYMIPAMQTNFKNPTDPTTGNPVNPEPGTIWALELLSPYDYPDSVDYIPGDLANLDTVEEWSFNPSNNTLYLYPSSGYIPNRTNVRVRVRDRFLNFTHSDNIEFKNIHFFAGSFWFYNCSYLTIENCKFSFSSEMGLRGNNLYYGTNTTARNCIFEYINENPPWHQQRTMYPTMENCLFRYNDWFASSANYPVTDRNYRGSASANNLVHGGSTWRYVTVENSYTAGIFAGYRSLTEYCRLENLYDWCDCSGIQRNGHNTVLSTTRYCWRLNGARNGIRFNSKCGGNNADIHHVVSLGGKRGFRLKGDFHDAYHLLAFDNWRQDISLPDYKYCGLDMVGDDEIGNLNSNIHNSIAESSLECNSPDCGDSTTLDPEFLYDSSGIWFGRTLNENRFAAFPHLELENPWTENRNYSDSYLNEQFGYNPFWYSGQSYDFRPKKGSSLIDAGVIVPGVNDGQDIGLNHPLIYPGQNRRYVGDAPDIGAYEYGDSVYWIPGFRYPHPSVPIPNDNATNVPLEYGLAFNYPWSTNYSNITGTVVINGPGVSRTETLEYPNNVVFQTFLPNQNYNWNVTVNGVNSGNWNFRTSDHLLPLNDRSIDTSIVNGYLLPMHEEILEVKKNTISYLKFDIPILNENIESIFLNIVPKAINEQNDGIIFYQYNFQGWSEKFDDNNLGLIEYDLLVPIDTLYNLTEENPVSINLSDIINDTGEYSFALGVIDTMDNITFHSKESVFENSGDVGGFIPNYSVWPKIKFVISTLSNKIESIIPYVFALHQNYPNPFNPITTIKYDLPKDALTTINIYDIMGRHVKTLIENYETAGFKMVKWDATNNNGNNVSAGMYIYQIRAGAFNDTKKMVLLK